MERGPAAKAMTEPAVRREIEVLGNPRQSRWLWALPSDLQCPSVRRDERREG
jgi:hypothetical protein